MAKWTTTKNGSWHRINQKILKRAVIITDSTRFDKRNKIDLIRQLVETATIQVVQGVLVENMTIIGRNENRVGNNLTNLEVMKESTNPGRDVDILQVKKEDMDAIIRMIEGTREIERDVGPKNGEDTVMMTSEDIRDNYFFKECLLCSFNFI